MMSNKETTEVSEKNHHVKVFLPKKLVECLPKCPALPKERLRWNTNEEIASYLITFEKHEEWLSGSPKTRPQNGSLILYNRKKVKYRKDGYCWKKRRDGKTTREDHMKLKVQGMECLYGCYVHSSIVPTFHRRCYWLLQNPDIVLVHYLNVPALEDCAKLCGPILCSINSDRKEWLKWSKDELVSQLKPMFHGIKWTCSGANGTTEFSIEQLVQQVLESHQAKPPPRTHACLCSAGLGSPGHMPHKCGSTKHRIISPKLDPRPGPYPALTEVQNITEPEPPRRDLKPPRLPPADPPPELPTPLPLPPTGLPVLVMASLEKPPPPAPAPAPAPLALTPSQHLVAGGGEARGLLPSTDAAMETGEPAPAFDPDCFLNCPARGQTYGCQPPLEPPVGGNRFFIQDDGQPPGEGGLPSVPPGSDKPPGGLQEELYALMRPGTAPPFGLAFDSLISELLTDERAPHSEPPPPTGPCTPEPGDASRPNTLVTITDFSPEWSYPEGGVKVLITGPWTEGSDAYSCLFDQVTVPAALIQPGVLRCYCPAHEAGLVALQVARDSRPVSTSVLFEYRARNFLALPSTQVDWLSLDDNQFRMSILERLEQMEKRMAEMTAAQPPAPCGPPTDATLGQVNFSPTKGARARVSGLAQTRCYSWLVVGSRGGIFRATTPGKTRILSTMMAPADSFEARIVALCEQMMAGSCWLRSETLVHNMSFRGMTLLHLAAAQGYARLIQTLIRWRNLSAESLDLEQEVDPLNVDHFSCTPLMWACALGHLDAALLLYRWNQRALAIPDSLGRLPLAVARSRGHVALATRLEDLQRAEAEPPGPLNAGPGKAWPPLRIASPLSASPDTGLSGGSSASSPSEHSEASLSLTSAYSSGSGARDSPPASPEAEVGAGGGPMDMCPPPGGTWYLPEPPSPPGTPAPPFFMDYEVESGAAAAPGLLGYSEDAENEDFLPPTDVLQVDMVTLARQIIEATPEHIKQEEFGVGEGPRRDRGAAGGLGGAMAWLASYLDSVDQLPGLIPHRREAGSPSQRGCLSPLQPGEPGPERRAAPPTAAGWAEFLNASANGRMESAFAGLTLSDPEQRELYEAARVIQTAFRRYKGRRLKEQQEMAAAVIQRCYRKYKQYALYKKMTQAAILIQSKFRSYWEQKKFQQSRRAAVLIQQCYRSYRADAPARPPRPPVPHRLRGPFLTKKQDQAARKIMRFLRRCRHRMKELKQSQELEGAQKRGLAT